ncbi:hypothetical protein AAF712_012362 [Marasmius tenuissimus]|uniref:Uncharacterized protein n=1 Tax=Marasmius tenuissimus TaxID=585030 RepID=A0ABR2ZHN8_9AGAR
MYPGQSLCLVAGGTFEGGGGSSTVTVASAGPVQTATAPVTLTQTYTLSASNETGTKTLSRTTGTTTVPISVTATETSLVTTTATVTTTQSTIVTVTGAATPFASCPSISRFVCAAKDKSGGDLSREMIIFSATPETHCGYFGGPCLYKKADGTLIIDLNKGDCPATMALVYASQ